MNQKKILTKLNGFTLIELMVVLGMIGIISGAVIANYASGRTSRSLRIGANELVTNIRKVQSYTLSSRALPGNVAAQYYLLRFDPTTVSSINTAEYKIQGMYDTDTTPAQLRDIETINLPGDIKIQSITVNGVAGPCLLLAFKLPFANILANRECSGNTPTVTSADDYGKIISFVTNNANTTVSSDAVSVITLASKSGATVKILINGVTGVVCPTQDGATCQTNY